jgi:cold shock CspA family protein
MRLSGTLRSWKDDRGFGFIAPTHGGAELFVHISALPNDGSRPTTGERLTYELGRGKNGQPQAINVMRTAIGPSTEHTRRRNRRPKQNQDSAFLSKIIVCSLLLALVVFGFNQYQKRSVPSSQQQPQPSGSYSEALTAPVTKTLDSKCDGRTHCSQMTSCSEAKFFLKNCPGTQMDGNNDGTPCEQQWCSSPFSR